MTIQYSNSIVTVDKLRLGAKDIYDNSYNRLLDLETSNANPVYCYSYPNLRFSDHVYISSHNLNGHFVNSFRSILNTAKFNFGINLTTVSERLSKTVTYTKERPYITLTERYKNFDTYIDVFMNGVKVNPNDTFITVYNGSFDLYLHQKYFTQNQNDLIILTGNKLNHFKKFYSNVTLSSYTCSITPSELASNGFVLGSNITKENMILDVFINGLHQNIKDLNYNYTASGITLNLVNLPNPSYIEINYGKNYQLSWEGKVEGNLLYIPSQANEFTQVGSYSWELTKKVDTEGYYTFAPNILAAKGINQESYIADRWEFSVNGIKQILNTDYTLETYIEEEKIGVKIHFALNPGNKIVIARYRSGFNEGIFRSSNEIKNGVLDKLPLGTTNLAIYIDGIRKDLSSYRERLYHIIELDGFNKSSQINNISYILSCNSSLLASNYSEKEYYNYSKTYMKLKFDDYHKDPLVPTLFDLAPNWIKTPTSYPPITTKPFFYNPATETKPFDQFLVEYINDSIRNDHIDNFRRALKYFTFRDKESYQYGNTYKNYLRNDTSIESPMEPIIFDTPKIVYRFDLSSLYSKYQELVFINGIKIDSHKYKKLIVGNRLNIYIDSDLITNTTDVLVWVIPIFNEGYKRYSIPKVGIWLNTPYYIEGDKIGVIRDIDDMILYHQDSDKNLVELVKNIDYTLSYNASTNIIGITPLIEFNTEVLYLINGSFTEYRLFKGFHIVDHNYVLDDEVYDNGALVASTLRKSRYNILLFKNGKLLVKDRDYYLINYKYGSINKHAIVFGVGTNDSDIFEYYYIEKTYEMINYQNTSDSGFGIVYLENFPLPYDKSYIDFYINGKLVNPNNIEEITSRVVRFKEETVPIYDLVARNNLNMSLNDLGMFLPNFNASQDLFTTWLLDHFYSEKDKFETWYPKAFPGEEKNTELIQDEPSRVNPIVYFVANDWSIGGWLIDQYNQAGYTLPRVIDANENIMPFISNVGKYLPFFTNDFSAIELNANILNIFDENYLLDANLYAAYSPKNDDWIASQVMSHFRLESRLSLLEELDANKVITEFYKTELSKHINVQEYNNLLKSMNDSIKYSYKQSNRVIIDANQ